MEIVWLGHSCFRLKGASLTLVTDPFDSSLGYSPGALRADVVTVSHEGPHHSHVERVQGARKVLRGPGEFEIAEVLIQGIKTPREDRGGANIIFRFTMDNLAVCHLGDIAGVPSADHVSAIGDVDILLLPVGGGQTLNAAQASETVALLEPKVIIPMHYKTEVSSAPLDPVDAFLREFGVADLAPVAKLAVSASSLAGTPRVVLLDYRAG